MAEFDFYLPKYNCFIEMDGGLGHGKKSYSKLWFNTEESKKKDMWKDKQANNNGYIVFRVPADESDLEYLKQNITNKLSSLLDLSNVDWLICDKAGLKSLVKEVSDYYMEHYPITTTELSKIFNRDYGTIRKYLLKGAVHGRCDYTVDSAKIIRKLKSKSQTKTRDKLYKSKPIDVYDYISGQFIKSYISIAELARSSKDDFGKQFYDARICAVAKGRKSKYNGYVFKYA